MNASQPPPLDITGELTLLDLVLAVQESTASDDETVEIVHTLLESGRVRLRSAARRPASPGSDRAGEAVLSGATHASPLAGSRSV